MAFTPNSEPAAYSGAIAELFRQGMFLLLAFDFVHWSQGQQASALSFVSAALAVGSILFTRSQSVSTNVANEQIKTALQLPPTTSIDEVIQKTADK